MLLAFDEDRFSERNYAEFYLYFLRDAYDYGDGTVACNYTTDADLLSVLQEPIHNTSVLSNDFASFNATEGLAFFYKVFSKLQVCRIYSQWCVHTYNTHITGSSFQTKKHEAFKLGETPTLLFFKTLN